MQWSANVDEAFHFKTHSDAEINGRMVLDWLGDPMNRHLKLMSVAAEITHRTLIVGKWYPVNTTRVV
jgi:hypothetical protein